MLPSLSIKPTPAVHSGRLRALAAGFALMFASPALLAEWGINMTEGVTALSAETYSLHMLIFWICVAIGVLVYGVLIYSMIAYRKSKGAVPATFNHNTTAEII